MSEEYKRFIRQFKAVAISKGMSVQEVADVIGVNMVTVYSWWRFNTVMDGDRMLRVVKKIMGGLLSC